MAAHPSLPAWQNFKNDGWVLWEVRCTLARILRLPPQVFQVQLHVKRPRKFPVYVPLHNLRPLLGVTDTEELAERVSKALQDQVAKLKPWRFGSWQHLPPAASISCCRANSAGGNGVLSLSEHTPPGEAMASCMQLCSSRLQLQLAGQLPGLAELAQSRSSSSSSCALRRASSPGSGEPRERLAALQLGRQPSSHEMAAAAGKLPDIATARQAAAAQLGTSLPQPVADRLAPAAMQLMLLDKMDTEAQQPVQEQQSGQKKSFKVVGHLVMAMKRLQASLNPTYNYGKRTSDSGNVEVLDPLSNRVVVQPKAAAGDARTASGRTASGRTASGRPTSAGQHHGYKGSLLFRPLPEPEGVKSG
ncbi:hypothetical protein OEZ86_011472 [Tetradesmus obliquus]|nr:hypothetical protein OEZ86_011472 [Tetradesmus obliquus]